LNSCTRNHNNAHILKLCLQACVELLKPTGGKLHAFLSSLPSSGIKALKMRDSSGSMAEKEKQMGLLPQDNTYLTLAAQAADFQVRRLLVWPGVCRIVRSGTCCAVL
jgi:protein transport protein SEC24